MRAILAACVVVVLAAPARGQDVPLKVEGAGVKTVTLVTSFPVTVSAPPGTGLVFWSYPANVQAADMGDKLIITGAPKGDLTITVKVVSAEVDWTAKKVTYVTRMGRVSLIVGDSVPVPVPPQPKPPGPVTGVRVLLVAESSANLGKGHLTVWNSTALKSYLDATCAKGADGRPEWRKWDRDVVLTKETPTLTQLWTDTKPQLGTLPVIVIVTDQSGEIYPLPDTIEATLALLKSKVGA